MSNFLFGLMLIWALGILGVITGDISPWWLFLFLPLAALNVALEASS